MEKRVEFIHTSQKSGFKCMPETWRKDLGLALKEGIFFPKVLVSNLRGQRGAAGCVAPSQIDMRQLPAEDG